MIFGFAINRKNGASDFGVVNAESEADVKKTVATEAEVDESAVVVMSVAEALSQFDDIAFLSPAEPA